MLNGYSYNFLKCLILWGVFCFFFSLNNSQCQKVSVLIWYRKLQNTSSGGKKKSIGKRKKAGVRTCGSTRLLPKPAEPTGTRRELRIAWRGSVCSRIFNCFFEGGRISPSGCGAQSTVPGTSHRAPRFRRFGFVGCCSFFFPFFFFLPRFRFQWKDFIFPGRKRSRLFPGRAASGPAGRCRPRGLRGWPLRGGAGRGTLGKRFRRD